jgi:hypothetical protein
VHGDCLPPVFSVPPERFFPSLTGGGGLSLVFARFIQLVYFVLLLPNIMKSSPHGSSRKNKQFFILQKEIDLANIANVPFI